MSAPTLHNLEFFRDAFPQIQLPDSWGILTTKSDDVIWNIVSSYLNSVPLSDENELTERVKCLAGNQEVQGNFKLSIEVCNPFLNRDACFDDKDVSNLVDKFKERVEYYINNDKILSQTPSKNFGYLEASSNLLSCIIVLISFPLQDKFLVNVFPVLTAQNSRWFSNPISVFNTLQFCNGNRQDQFSFSIPKDIGLERKRRALLDILKMTRRFNNEKMILQRVSHFPDITENLLISLLKSDFGKIITFIYESPSVLSKLADAGFETDPRAKDSTGKSAFFYALKTEESQLVFLLYDHAANACIQTDASVRSPDAVLFENLLCLKVYLKQLGKDLESEELSEKSRCLFRDLCRLNELQIEIRESIDKITIKYYDQKGKDYDALQRKELILTILKMYETYFDYKNVGLKPSVDADDILTIFQEFCKRSDYFYKLDFTTAVMFFDNLFFLKEGLKLPNNAYLDVESGFFLFIFFRKFFEQYEKQDYFVSHWIILQERLSLQSRLCSFKDILEKAELSEFKDILEKAELSEFNIIDKLPMADVQTLSNLPQIHGEFLIFRIQYYLNAATAVTVKDSKSILVIERCLQVLGESLRHTDFNSVQRILSLALPSNFVRNLKQICFRLAHSKPYKLHYRNNLEQNVKLFMKIQKDLVKLKKLLLPIYSFHNYEFDHFFLLHSVKYVGKSQRLGRKGIRKDETELKYILPSSLVEGNRQSFPTFFQKKWRNVLYSKISHLNRNETIQNETFSGYKCLVENLVLAIRKVLRSLKVPVHEKAIEELDSRFWCLESILSYLTKDQKLAEYRKPLVSILKRRNFLFKELREKTYHFQNINKPTYSDTDRSLDTENETVGKHLPSDSANMHYHSQQFNDLFENFDVSSRKEIQTDHDIIGENFQNRHDSILQETIDTEEYEEVSDLCKNVDSETLIEIEKVVLPSAKAISMTPCGDRLLAYVYNDYSDNSKEVYSDKSKDNYSDNRKVENPAEIMDEVISMKPRDDWLLVNVYNVNSDNSKEDYSDISKDDYSDNRNDVYLDNSKVKNPAEITDVKRNTFIEVAEKFLNEYEKITSVLFQKFRVVSNKNFYFKNIESYLLILKGKTFSNAIVTEEEKELVLRSVSEKFRNVPRLKKEIRDLLGEKVEFTEELNKKLYALKLKKKEIKHIKEEIENYGVIDDTIHIVDSARDYFLYLREVMESKELYKKNYNLLCEKLELSDKAKNILSKLVPRQKGKEKFQFESEHLKWYLRNEPNKETKKDLEDESAGIVKSKRDYFADHDEMVLERKETDESGLIWKNVENLDNAEKIFLNSGLNRKFNDSRFKFLRNRLKMLRNILIEENNTIQQLWIGATTLQKKIHLKEKMVQLYLKDSEIQASIEMLLFDFMTVLSSKELKELWRKTTNLFSGLNLRRVLFSDQPLLKSLDRLLEPHEIISELVEKMLNLISDENVINCMQQILEQSGNDFSNFMRIMDDDENKQFKNLREQILECDHWEEYALLIPSC